MPQRVNNRFWDSSRGRIVLLLRRGPATVGDLAPTLELTENAVRSHLTSLERDGLVAQTGSRRGTRKPTIVYGLSTEAEQLFPRLYGGVLLELLNVLKQTASPKDIDKIVRATGRRLASTILPSLRESTSLDRQAQAAVVLRELGGLCDSNHEDSTVVFRCMDCPLAAVVSVHPEVCRLVETVLTEVLGVRVRERCTPPECHFEFADS